MSSKSTLLIDEIVLPNKGASINVMQLDVTMMTMLNGKERTLPHWRKLLGEVRLTITEVYNYDLYGEDCVLEAMVLES
jgi:demethylsterigmatocystin 6-O-methyltransferase